MRIALIEDNASLRKVLSALLKSVGHEVVLELADGHGAADHIVEIHPDVLCLDYHLPGEDGLTILKRVQAAAPEIAVIFMTASADAQLATQAAEAGASGFIRKPFSQDQIVAEIRAVEETRAAGEGLPSRRPVLDLTGNPRLRRSAVIADDSGSVRLLLKGMLAGCGLQVLQTVGNGAEAVNAAGQHRPGLLFLDVDMPVMTGLEALPRILEASPDTQVVMVTGNPDRSLVEKAAALGAKGYILKPLRPAYVEGFVKKLFSRPTAG